jgi:DNA repair ATPase RecN
VSQIQGHKDLMEKRLVNLQKIGRSKHTLQVRIEDMESQYAELARQLTALRNMYNSIHLARPLSEEARPLPRLVAQRTV